MNIVINMQIRLRELLHELFKFNLINEDTNLTDMKILTHIAHAGYREGDTYEQFGYITDLYYEKPSSISEYSEAKLRNMRDYLLVIIERNEE